MDNSIFTPNLNYFMFSGVVEVKVHFVEAPSSLLHALIRITNYWWTFEYYSFLRDCLESVNCSRKVEIDIRDAEVLYTLFCNSFSATDILQLPVTHIALGCFKSLRLNLNIFYPNLRMHDVESNLNQCVYIYIYLSICMLL